MQILTKLSSLMNKFVRDKDGRIVIWQTPNLPLGGWFVLMVLSHLISNGDLKSGLQFVSTILLLIWSLLELTKGASYFRRVLGFVVFVNIVLSHFR